MFWLLFNFSRGRFFRSRRSSLGRHGSTGAACAVRPGRRCRCCLRPAQSSKSHVLRASCSCRGRAARSGRRRQCHAGAAQSVRVRRRRLRWCAAWPSLRHRHHADASRHRRHRQWRGRTARLFEWSLLVDPRGCPFENTRAGAQSTPSRCPPQADPRSHRLKSALARQHDPINQTDFRIDQIDPQIDEID